MPKGTTAKGKRGAGRRIAGMPAPLALALLGVVALALIVARSRAKAAVGPTDPAQPLSSQPQAVYEITHGSSSQSDFVPEVTPLTPAFLGPPVSGGGGDGGGAFGGGGGDGGGGGSGGFASSSVEGPTSPGTTTILNDPAFQDYMAQVYAPTPFYGDVVPQPEPTPYMGDSATAGSGGGTPFYGDLVAAMIAPPPSSSPGEQDRAPGGQAPV